MNDISITLQFSSARQISSWAIRTFTWSDFSHVDVWMGEKNLFGATPEHGVNSWDGKCLENKKLFQVKLPDVPAKNRIMRLIFSQRGKPYDFPAVFGFGFRRDWQNENSWLCSELITWAFQEAGYPLIRTDKPWRITPRDLLLSTRIVPVSAGERDL